MISQDFDLDQKSQTDELQDSIRRMIDKRFGGNSNGIHFLKAIPEKSKDTEMLIMKNAKSDKNYNQSRNIQIDRLHKQENFGERKRIKP